MHERRLARAGRPDDGDVLALGDLQVDPAQRGDGDGAGAVDLRHPLQLDHHAVRRPRRGSGGRGCAHPPPPRVTGTAAAGTAEAATAEAATEAAAPPKRPPVPPKRPPPVCRPHRLERDHPLEDVVTGADAARDLGLPALGCAHRDRLHDMGAVDHLGDGRLSARGVGDGGRGDLGDVVELLDDDADVGGRARVEARRVAGDVDDDREGRHVGALAADEAYGSDRAVVGRRRTGRDDVGLVTVGDLTDLGVVHRRVHDVGVGCDDHDLGTRRPRAPAPGTLAAAGARSRASRTGCPEPLLPEPVPVTCWPTVRFTEATVPEMVEVSDASFRAVWAFDSDDSAEVTAA